MGIESIILKTLYNLAIRTDQILAALEQSYFNKPTQTILQLNKKHNKIEHFYVQIKNMGTYICSTIDVVG